MLSIKHEYKRLGYPIFEGPGNLNLAVIRSTASRSGRFDDTIHLFGQDADGVYFHRVWIATVDAGTFYFQNFYPGQSACAVIAPGRYLAAYAVGRHLDHEALVQVGKIDIYRDGDLDDMIDPHGKRDSGLFGINIHSPWFYESDISINDVIQNRSAGCMVFEHPEDQREFMGIVKRHLRLNGPTLTLVVLSERKDGV